MPKKSIHADNSEFARAALVAEGVAFGALLGTADEGDATVTYLFENQLKGYKDWTWQVTLYQPKGQQPTVSELLLLPGEGALVAPAWVPWSERLADYKALQAELEAQAAEEEDEDDELLATESGEGEEPEADTEDAGVRPPSARSRNRSRNNNKKAKDESPSEDSE
jgi:hypothetical protein